jgi:DNA polymerase III delta subunit
VVAAGGSPQVFLIYGTDPVRINNERARLIGEFLPREHRAENLTGIEPAGTQPLRLRRIAADLVGELATPSFFPDIPRVVVVEQLSDLFQASRSGPTAGGRRKAGRSSPDREAATALCRFLERDLPQSNSILILTVIEQPDKRRTVSTSTTLYKTIASVGRVIRFKDVPAIFQLADAFTTRRLADALRALSAVLERDDGAASAFRMIARQVRFLIQAKLLEKFGRSDEEAAAFAADYFPPGKGLNLLKEHPFTREKVERGAARWTLGELNDLLPRLERLNKVVYPSSKDVYVPDPEVELERLLLEACVPKAQPAHKSR